MTRPETMSGFSMRRMVTCSDGTSREASFRHTTRIGSTGSETTRRELLARSVAVAALLAGAGVLPVRAQSAYNKVAFEAKSIDDVIKGLGIAKPVESKDIVFIAPDIAENGAVVPIVASTTLPGVQRIAFLVEKNPTTLAGVFEFTDMVETSISTRIKMAQTCNVLAVAMFGDGKVLFAQKEVKVTLGGCGG
jgi:sulfur-oxidizing protein SoxY